MLTKVMDWKNAKAKDIMKSRVVAVRPDTLVLELAKILDDNGIGGAPVITFDGRLVGVVSKTDLVRHHRGEGAGPDYRETRPNRLPGGFHVEEPDQTRVREIMTPAIIQAKGNTPAARLAGMMRRKRIHRIFITEGGKVRGVVTTMDLLGLMEERPRKKRNRSV